VLLTTDNIDGFVSFWAHVNIVHRIVSYET